MSRLPEGSVTFLFTDVEGSTRLQQEPGGSYREAIAEHERVLLDAASASGGVVVDRQTESFFIAFARAIDAVAAAAYAQRRLTGAVRVRMGLHTGEPSVVGDRYLGLDVSRAARICAAAPRLSGAAVGVDPRTRRGGGSAPRYRAPSSHRVLP